MAIRAEISAFRNSALQADEGVETARYALMDAGTEVRRLRADARARVTSDPAWQSARDLLEAARMQYAGAG